MKTFSVREMKAQWPEVQRYVQEGETVLVLNHGRPAAQILPPKPNEIEEWEDHMVTAIPNRGKSVEETVRAARGERW